MSLSALMSAPWCWHKRLFMWPVNGVKRRRLRGEGGRRSERMTEREREREEIKKKWGGWGGKNSKQEIPQSWYHMPGPPFLMRQRSMYSLALSYTGGTPIMPKLTCSNKTPPPSPTRSTPRSGSQPPTIQCRPFAFPDREPCLISQEFHIDGVRQLSPDREKELGIQRCPPLRSSSPPLSTHINNQKKRNFLASVEFFFFFDWRRNKQCAFSMCILRLRLGKHTPIPAQVVTVMLIYVFLSPVLSFFKPPPQRYFWVPACSITLSFSSISKV